MYAKQHGLKIGTIEDLIRYRIENEKTIKRVAETELATEHGNFRLHAYRDSATSLSRQTTSASVMATRCCMKT